MEDNLTIEDRVLVTQTKIRLKRMGVDILSADAMILFLAREIEYYREKIIGMEEFYNVNRKTRRSHEGSY